MAKAKDRMGLRIEALLAKRDWRRARAAIEKQLAKEPDDHWLWARLAGAKYEQRDYQGALQAAEKALAIVPDCPLAIWSQAGALELLGTPAAALNLYSALVTRGIEQLRDPDEDAEECWEGPDWTAGLAADCAFRAAECLERLGSPDRAIKMYRSFLNLWDLGVRGIYSRDEAQKRIKRLLPDKQARQDAAVKIMKSMKKELIPS